MRYLGDSDEDVRSSANSAITQAFGEFKSEEEPAKAEYLKTLLSANGALDEDSVTMLSGELKALSDEALAAETVTKILAENNDPKVLEEMKECYEFITSEEYTDSQAAERWIADKRAELAEEQNLEN